MAVFRHELRLLIRTALIWVIALSGVLLLLMPVLFVALAGSQEAVDSLMNVESSKKFFEAMQLSPTLLETSEGVYAYLTTFMNVALATAGGVFGLAVMTREHHAGAVDFLYTKGRSRSAIFWAKCAAAVLLIGFVGLVYMAVGMLGMYNFAGEQFSAGRIAWMASTGLMLALLYLFFALFLGALFPRIQSTGLVALGVAFMTFVLGSIGALADEPWFLLFCPFNYLDATTILRDGMPEPLMLLRVLLLSVGFVAAAWALWFRRAFTERG